MAARMALLLRRSLHLVVADPSTPGQTVPQQETIGAGQPLRAVPRADEFRLNGPLRCWRRQRTARSALGHGASPRLDDSLPNGLYASSGARPISAPPRPDQRRPTEGYRGRKVKSVDCVRIVHVLSDVQYAIDAGEAAFAPALRRLLCWAVAVGRRRADLKDTTLAQYRATAERRLDRLIAMPGTTPAGRPLPRQT